MKNTFKVLGIALLGMALATACKNAPAEEAVDTIPPVDTTVCEEVIDSVVDEPVIDEPVKTTAKKATKKEETKAEKHDASKVTIQTENGSASFGKGGASVSTSDQKHDASKVTIQTENGSASFGKGGVEIKKN